MTAWLPLGLVVLVGIIGMGAIVGTIKMEAKLTRDLTQINADEMRSRLDTIHTLTNSSLTSVKASLEQAYLKIETLEASLAQIGAERRQREQR